MTIADVQGDHKADNGDQKIKPHNAGNTDLRKLCGDQRDREAGDTAGSVEDAGCFAFSVREAHRHDCRTQLQHSASGGKADDKSKAGHHHRRREQAHQQQRNHRQASINNHRNGRAKHLFDEGGSYKDADQRADGIDAKQFNRRGIGQADDELAVLRQPLADQIEGRHADITVQGEDHHIQLISLWPDGCFRLCRRGFLFFRCLAVRERHFKQINPAQYKERCRNHERPAEPQICPYQEADNERQQELPCRDEGFDQHVGPAGRVRERFHQRRIGTGVEEAVRQARHNAEHVSQIDIFGQQDADEKDQVTQDPKIDKGLATEAIREKSGHDGR